jgi:hypothetical protein
MGERSLGVRELPGQTSHVDLVRAAILMAGGVIGERPSGDCVFDLRHLSPVF